MPEQELIDPPTDAAEEFPEEEMPPQRQPRPVRAITRRQPQEQAISDWVPSFAITVADAVEQVKQRRLFYEKVMVEGLHYGPIPGTDEKPSLLKPGAELLLASMSLHPSYGPGETGSIVDLSGANTINEQGHNEPYVRHERKCFIYRQTGPAEGDRVLIAEGEGSCNSWEKKYRSVKMARVCPECGSETIMRSKYAPRNAPEGTPPGWYCWKKNGGCGLEFDADDQAITDQEEGLKANPYIADLDNTILKMANKRALVAACLNATACSDIFTQDMEEAHAARVKADQQRGQVRGPQQAAPRSQPAPAPRQGAPAPQRPAAGANGVKEVPCPKCGVIGNLQTKRSGGFFCKGATGGCGEDISAAEFEAAKATVAAGPVEDDRPPIDAYDN